MISGNTISDNSGAITLSESVNVTVTGNNIFDNSFALNLNGVSTSYIHGNNITGNTRNYQKQTGLTMMDLEYYLPQVAMIFLFTRTLLKKIFLAFTLLILSLVCFPVLGQAT